MKDVTVTIIQNKAVSSSFSLLTFTYPYPVLPGQFVHVRLNDRIDPFLRRPFSIHDCDAKKKTITLLYKRVGKGTNYLATLPKGTALTILGPLGNSFSVEGVSRGSTVALIGGGIGFAPLLFLARKLSVKGVAVHTFMGFKTKAEVFVDAALKQCSEKVHIATDDGSFGECGFVTDCFSRALETTAFDQVFVCGPDLMMKRIHALCTQKDIPLQLSLESIMACGLGACMCCVSETKAGYKKVCSDGPVFTKEELPW